jgi:hypothetical protein
MGIELAIGYLIAWASRKVGRAVRGLDREVDHAMDQSLTRLHDLVSRKLGSDPGLAKLADEAAKTGEATARTQTRVRLALEDAAENDEDFRRSLEAAITDTRTAFGSHENTGTGVTQAEHKGKVESRSGGVSVGNIVGSPEVSITTHTNPLGPSRI